MIYLLDTDHVSELQIVSEANRRLVRRLSKIAPDDFGTTIVSFEEQMRGRLAQIASVAGASNSVNFYQLLNRTLRFYSSFAVWQFSEAASARFETLQKSKLRVGTQDLKIAAIALSVSATLLTRNVKDFAKIPGLLQEDWTM